MSGKEGRLRFWRVLKIDQLIRENVFPSVRFLAQKFEVSARTIERDIEFLRDSYEAPIEYDFIRRGYVYTDNTFFLKSLFLSGEELFSIAVFEKTLSQYRNTPLELQLKKVFEKLTALLPDELISIDTMWLDDSLTFIADPAPEINRETFIEVFSGLKTRHAIRFLYRSLEQDEAVPRIADPYHIVCQRGAWYVIALCREKKELRIFAFSRMKNVRILPRSTFDIPENFNPAEHIDMNMGVWLSNKNAFQVKLLFSPSVGVFAEERIWNADQNIRVHKDKSVEVSFSTTQFVEVKRFVLGQGATVKVLEPPELAEAVKEEIEKMRNIY